MVRVNFSPGYAVFVANAAAEARCNVDTAGRRHVAFT